MVPKLFALSAVFLIVLSVAKNGSAQYWIDIVEEQYVPQQVVPNYNQQRPYQQQQQTPYPQQGYPQQVVSNHNQQRPYQQQQRPYQQQQRPQQQQQRPYQQQGYPQQVYPNENNVNQQNPSVSLSEAEWVCTNPKTNDMMIITSENAPAIRSDGQGQWQQPSIPQPVQPPTNNQPTHPEVQPSYPQTQPVPNNQPTPPPVNSNYPTTSTTTTTEKPPVWPDSGNNGQPSPPATTTERPLGPIWSVVPATTQKPSGAAWPDSGNNQLPGFTVAEPTPKPKPQSTTTQGPPIDDNDDGPIQIVMGKK